jgi:hypothetical protein
LNFTASPAFATSTEQLGVYMAESIQTCIAEGRSYDLSDYGIEQNPGMIALVIKALHE